MDKLLEIIKELEDTIPQAKITFEEIKEEIKEECRKQIYFERRNVVEKELTLELLRKGVIKKSREEAKWGHHKSFILAHLWVRYVNAPNSLYRNTYYPLCSNSMDNKPIEEINFMDEESTTKCKHCSRLKGE
jgi:hypothetical protein